ncbi:MAG: putative toxin-antitoxin system toxin component, PIN family [Myxococcota bacterium]
MSGRPFIVDSNVVVSGLLTRDVNAATAVLLDAMLSGEAAFVLSLELLTEYRSVLLRPTVRRRHGLAPNEVDAILEQLAEHARIREGVTPVPGAPDPGDDHLWALLRTVPEAILVTGDKLLLEHPPSAASVVSPREAVRWLRRAPEER